MAEKNPVKQFLGLTLSYALYPSTDGYIEMFDRQLTIWLKHEIVGLKMKPTCTFVSLTKFQRLVVMKRAVLVLWFWLCRKGAQGPLTMQVGNLERKLCFL